VVTGLGNESPPFPARLISDISCQAMGCHRLFPQARTVIDIGVQFTKVVKITPQGKIADFLMSEKCATGSGRFLQVIARILQVRLEDIGPLSLQSQKPVEFSTNCAVFAESETISRIAEGTRAEDILAGVHRAMAAKVAMLVKRVKMEPDVAAKMSAWSKPLATPLVSRSWYRICPGSRPLMVPPVWRKWVRGRPFFFTAKTQSPQRNFLLNNPLRGGIVQPTSVPANYPEGSEASQLPASHRPL
jgi:hypothetical protein